MLITSPQIFVRKFVLCGRISVTSFKFDQYCAIPCNQCHIFFKLIIFLSKSIEKIITVKPLNTLVRELKLIATLSGKNMQLQDHNSFLICFYSDEKKQYLIITAFCGNIYLKLLEFELCPIIFFKCSKKGASRNLK